MHFLHFLQHLGCEMGAQTHTDRNVAFATPCSIRQMREVQRARQGFICPRVCMQETEASSAAQEDNEHSPAVTELVVPAGNAVAPRKIRRPSSRLLGNKRQGQKYVDLQPNPPGLRIAAGTARGRTIKSPNVYLRPMMAKVREALFSMLQSFDIIRSDGTVLDLFAGSGSVGIEALSRGMGSATFVDFAQECMETTEQNLQHCDFVGRGQTVCALVEEFLTDGERYNGGKHYDLITITPPYEEVDYSELMDAVANSACVGEGTFVVVEYPVELKTFPPVIGHRLVGMRNRRYGRTVIALYACQPNVDELPRPEEFVNVKSKKRRKAVVNN